MNPSDKHIHFDILKDGKFNAKDLRLRFQFGNVTNPDELVIPKSADDQFNVHLDQMTFNFHLFCAEFDGLKDHWEKGGDDKNSWIDFVLYSGSDKNFNLSQVNEAILGYTFSIGTEQGIR